MDKTFSAKSHTLTDSDISSRRSLTRRSLLAALGVGLGAAAATVVGAGSGAAQQGQGCTDNDFGANEDPPGAGRRCRPFGRPPSSCTDNDMGGNQDPPGGGVRCRPPDGQGGPDLGRPKACTDSDGGPNQDPPGLGINCWT
jgi:hypothetical protein